MLAHYDGTDDHDNHATAAEEIEQNSKPILRGIQVCLGKYL